MKDGRARRTLIWFGILEDPSPAPAEPISPGAQITAAVLGGALLFGLITAGAALLGLDVELGELATTIAVVMVGVTVVDLRRRRSRKP